MLPLSVAGAGFRSIAVNLVNAGIGQWGLPADEDLNAILGDIHLRKLAAGESPVDERLIVGPSLSNQPATVPIAFPLWCAR